MPDTDQQTQTTAQGDPAAPPANPNPNPTPQPTDTTPPTGDPSEPNDVEGYKRLIEKLRAESRDAKSTKKQLEDAQAKLQAAEDAQKTEQQRAVERAVAAEKRATDFETQLRAQSVRHAVSSAARDAGFINPDDAHRFLDLGDITLDDKGEPQGVAEAVKQLATDKTYLINSTAPPKSPPPPSDKSQRPPGSPSADEARAAELAFHQRHRASF